MCDIVELCWLCNSCGCYCLFVLWLRCVVISVLSPWETIGSLGVCNFVLVKKPQAENSILDGKQVVMARKGSGSWKAWFNKSLSRKIVSY